MKIEYRKLTLIDSDKIRIWRNKQLSILRQNQTISRKKQIAYFKKNYKKGVPFKLSFVIK